MRTAQITRRQAEAMTDGLDTDDAVAVQERVFERYEREQVRRSAEIDQLLQDVEHKLVTAQKIEAGRMRVNATDQRSPRRSRRRSDKVALRRIPTHLPVAELDDLADVFEDAA